MAISTAARTSVHASVNKKVASISAGSALLTTIGPGCWVRHHVTLKCTTGTSMNPKMPTTAAISAAWRPAATSINATAAAAAFSYLFIEHEACGQRSEHHEKYVEVDQKADRLLVVARQSHRGLHGHTAGDHERDPQRKGEQRKEQLARTHPGHDGGEQDSQCRHAERRQQDSGDHFT